MKETNKNYDEKNPYDFAKLIVNDVYTKYGISSRIEYDDVFQQGMYLVAVLIKKHPSINKSETSIDYMRGMVRKYLYYNLREYIFNSGVIKGSVRKARQEINLDYINYQQIDSLFDLTSSFSLYEEVKSRQNTKQILELIKDKKLFSETYTKCILYFICGYGTAEIGKIIGKSTKQVYYILKKSKEILDFQYSFLKEEF